MLYVQEIMRKFFNSLQNINNHTANYSLIFISIVYICIVYSTYICNGGFIIDDWGAMLTAYSGKTFSNIYASFLPLFTNRPLAPLPLAVTSLLFGGEPAFYIFINTILWLATAGILGIILYPFLGYYSYFFFFLAATPIIGSTVIFSPVMQLTATVSLFYGQLQHICFLNIQI
jgi:hypothetical protein